MSRVFDVAGMIVVLAIIATLVSHRQTSQVIKAGGSVFTDSIKAAKG
jgi:deoxyhypusine synthase